MRKSMFLIVALLGAVPLCSAAQTASGPTGVEDFVRRAYIEGLSYDAAKEYATPKHLEPLLAMLADTEDAPYWPNVTMVLGLSGNDAVVDPLIDFVRGTPEWSTAIYRGRMSGVTALGYYVHESSDDHSRETALDYLRRSVHPEVWISREIPWLGGRDDEERLRVQLSVSAVLGLALTGTEEAAQELEELRNAETTPARLRRVAESVRSDLYEIRKNGLAAYYGSEKSSALGSVAAARR